MARPPRSAEIAQTERSDRGTGGGRDALDAHRRGADQPRRTPSLTKVARMNAPVLPPVATRLFGHVEALFPICRSITGPGLRATLDYIGNEVPLQRSEVPSGTQVLDWTVPQEWTPRGAVLETLDGKRLLDFADNNLHLLQYSRAIDAVVPREELQRHLHSLPNQPELVPYRTAYFAETWGLCLSHDLRQRLTAEAYRVRIDTTLADGALSYGECVIPGEEPGEVLVSSHCCHPSLANDNLSAVALAIEWAKAVAARPRRRFTWRFVFAPGTIGAVCWLAANRDARARIRHGLVLSCLGDGEVFHWKRTRREDAGIDRIAAHVLRHDAPDNVVLPFEPWGYDERQYGSPGFDLPVGCLSRAVHGTFPEYHTSADNLHFVRPEHLARSFGVLRGIEQVIEEDGRFRNTAPYGEPQLGKRGLYRAIGGEEGGFDQLALLWVLNQSDGGATLLDIAERSGRPFAAIRAAAEAARAAGLLVPVSTDAQAGS
jgi:aminopeptidase-like protein